MINAVKTVNTIRETYLSSLHLLLKIKSRMKANSAAVSRTKSRKDAVQDRFASRGGEIFKDGPKRNFMLRLDLAKPEPIAESRKAKLNGMAAAKAMQSGTAG